MRSVEFKEFRMQMRTVVAMQSFVIRPIGFLTFKAQLPAIKHQKLSIRREKLVHSLYLIRAEGGSRLYRQPETRDNDETAEFLILGIEF